MNIVLSLFVDQLDDNTAIGAYFQSPLDKRHHFYGEIAADEENAIIAILERLDTDFEELGQIQFVTITTNHLNFLCKGKSAEGAPPSIALKSFLKKLNTTKGTRFKKNEAPETDDVIALSRADMMCSHIRRKFEIDGSMSLMHVDKDSLSDMKKSYKALPNIFLGSKLFHWGDTEVVTLNGEDFSIYYNGGFTPKGDTLKKNNNVSEFDKLIRSKLYTYYTGSNSTLTDAGQRSLEEIRCITLVNEPHPVVEKFFELQNKGLADLPVTPVYTAVLDKVIGAASSRRIMDGDEHWFDYNGESRDLVMNGITRTDISYVFYPQRLGPRIRNQFLDLRSKFLDHLQGKVIGEEYDITDYLFEYSQSAKGKPVCKPKDVLSGKFNFIKIPKMNFDGLNFTLKYTFDIDCPGPRVLKKLLKLNPRVSLVFENISDSTITYYTIVRTDIGVSIYSCPEGSRLVRRKR